MPGEVNVGRSTRTGVSGIGSHAEFRFYLQGGSDGEPTQTSSSRNHARFGARLVQDVPVSPTESAPMSPLLTISNGEA